MTKALPSISVAKADFKTYFRNFHLEKNTQFGKWCKGDLCASQGARPNLQLVLPSYKLCAPQQMY